MCESLRVSDCACGDVGDMIGATHTNAHSQTDMKGMTCECVAYIQNITVGTVGFTADAVGGCCWGMMARENSGHVALVSSA